MLVNMKDILEDARINKYAIGCINTPTVDTLRAVVGAAEALGTPIIIDHAQVHDPLIPIEFIGPYMIEFAKKAKVPVCVHLDHASDYNFVMRAIQQGFTSIMYDCSALPFEENAENLKAFTKLAHNLGITVEAELGVMASTDSDSHGGPLTTDDIRKFFTIPSEAGQFVDRTHVDALVVCFGTMHGIYATAPVLDLNLLKEIKKVTGDTHLVLHGGSGVDPIQTKAAIDVGCTKVNFYSYMATATSRFVGEKMAAAKGPVFYHELTEAAVSYNKKFAMEVMQMFMNGHKFS